MAQNGDSGAAPGAGRDRFAGKVVIITGAASGIGRSTAVQLCAEGATVVGVDVSEAGLAETAALVAGGPGSFSGTVADIASRDACRAVVADTVAAHGGLDVLLNVAGVLRAGHFTDITEAEFALIMNVNVGGTFWMCQAAIPQLLERRGNIVNVGSNAGLMGQAYFAHYCASKGAVVNFTRALAMEFVKSEIRVNCVAPGGVQTPMTTQDLFPDDIDWKLIAPAMGFRPMAHPDDIASVIAFVASDDARYVHGAIISADGALTAG